MDKGVRLWPLYWTDTELWWCWWVFRCRRVFRPEPLIMCSFAAKAAPTRCGGYRKRIQNVALTEWPSATWTLMPASIYLGRGFCYLGFGSTTLASPSLTKDVSTILKNTSLERVTIGSVVEYVCDFGITSKGPWRSSTLIKISDPGYCKHWVMQSSK